MYVVDSTHFPLVVTGITSLMAEEEVKKYLDEQAENNKRAVAYQKKMVIASLLDNHNSTAAGRTIMAKYIKQSPPGYNQTLHSVVVLTPNSFMRGALTAMQWVFEVSVKLHPVKDITDMHKYIESVFTELQYPVPRSLQSYLEETLAKLEH